MINSYPDWENISNNFILFPKKEMSPDVKNKKNVTSNICWLIQNWLLSNSFLFDMRHLFVYNFNQSKVDNKN